MNSDSTLPTATAPDCIPVNARGFDDEERATNFAHYIAETVRIISRYIDLSRLDGITVAYDYEEALSQLDRGYKPTRKLSRTSTDQLLGVAMAPAVIRNGNIKGHLVFSAPRILPIEDAGSDSFKDALYLIAHECAHIEDLRHRDERFPKTILQTKIIDTEEAFFAEITSILWEEYAACRISAPFGSEQAQVYEESFISVLDVANDKANEAIRSYRSHADLNRVLEEAGTPLCEPLRIAAYLIGHLDGLQENWDIVPQAFKRLEGNSYSTSINQLADALDYLWSTRENWETYGVFDPLKEIVRKVLATGGMIITRQSDGQMHLDIPFTSETI